MHYQIVIGNVYINLECANDHKLYLFDTATCRMMIISDRWLHCFEKL